MWEVVYETEDYGQGYGFAKVGIKMPDSYVIWLASTDSIGDRFTACEKYAKEICRHMNSIKEVEP